MITNRGRYPAPTRQLGTECDFTLPDTERRLWLEMPSSPGRYPVHSDEHDVQRLGLADPGREENHGLAPGNSHAVGTERLSGNAERSTVGQLQGPGAISFRGQGLPVNAGRLDCHPQRHDRKTGRLENSEEISHDRTGTHTQKHLAHPGTGIERHAENTQYIPGQPSAQPGGSRPSHPPATGENRATPGRAAEISAALATLERYTRELGTALVAFERLVERQIERLREKERERQRSRRPRLGR